LQAFDKRGVFVLTLSLLAVLGVGIAFYKGMPPYRAGISEPAATDGEKAKRRDTIAALGRIEPWNGIINLGAGSPPDRLESLFVERGDTVPRGEVLGYLAGYQEQMAQRDMLAAQLNEAKSRLEAETAVNSIRLRTAEVNRQRVLEVSPFRIAAQEQTIAGLESKHANEKDIQAAREHLSELKKQFEIDKIDSALQIDLARAALERAKVEFPITSLTHQGRMSELHAKRLALYAPCDCRVLNVRVKAGEEVGTGPIMSLGDTSRMRAVAEVYETDIPRVRLGQAATVSSRMLSKPISGKVDRIGSMIFKNDLLHVDPAARADARVVEVWIDLKDAEPVERLTNLTVDVVINTSASGDQVAW
jgi:HlyD family secretion protein